MIPTTRSWFGLLSLIVPSLAAWRTVAGASDAGLVDAATKLLVPLWLVMAGALAVRVVEGWGWQRRGGPPALAHADVLTQSGRAMAWLGAGAIVLSTITGWASLAVVGVLGLAVVYVAVIWTALVAGGADPWRGATVERSITPLCAVEGDALREEITLRGVRVPTGFHLFVRGTAGGAGDERVSRYAVGAEASRAEVLLSSDLGPARRGEHDLPPLALRLGDVFGLTRTPLVHRGAARYTALPRPVPIAGARKLLGRGGDDSDAVPSQRMPTEGWFRLREYAPGDDTRRIHWLRSVASRQLVVRLPDEIPPAEPAVRLVLDHQLIGADRFSCRAPAELLDALVRVWLGVGRALVDAGVRVDLVAATRRGDGWVRTCRPLRARGALGDGEALRLGARVGWQGSLPLTSLVDGDAGRARCVVVSSRPRPVEGRDDLLWIVVPEVVWTTPEAWPPPPSYLSLPFPIGSPENRLSHRIRAKSDAAAARRDGAIFNDLLCWTDWTALRGAFVARPSGTRVALEVIP